MENTKQKGNLGFSATLKELHKLGYNVFSEIGDNSRIDMIVEVNKKLIKIQVKYAFEKNGAAKLIIKKSGPNGYRYSYTTEDVDLFSVYLPNLDKVLFVPSKIACESHNMFVIRIQDPKNNQTVNVHRINDFEDLNKILLGL